VSAKPRTVRANGQGINLRQLESFVRVAELGSFSKAARVLDIAQPALSRQVRLLETDLRETLLLRNGRGVALTPAGRRLFEHGVQILQQVALARADLGAQRDAPVGQVTIGLPPSIGRRLTQPLIEGFRAQMPQAQVTIVEGLSAHIAEWIASGRADLGLLYNPEPTTALEITPLPRQYQAQRLEEGAAGHGSAARSDRRAADRARAPPVVAPAARIAGDAGRGTADDLVRGVEHSVDHRPGLRAHGQRGAARQRGGSVRARSGTRGAAHRRARAAERAVPGAIGQQAADAADARGAPHAGRVGAAAVCAQVAAALSGAAIRRGRDR
jgi:DNA-binding transcriptional LysR family regulator